MALTDKKCIPCEGGIPTYTNAEAEEMMEQVPGWILKNGRLYREFQFKNFTGNMRFLNLVADLAEEEGHHPNFCVHYNKVQFEIWTHAIGGLSENDFILAAKINKLAG